MKDIREANRRTVLKTIGAGAVGSMVLAGTASARGGKAEGDGNSYGNGNAIGKFLNEEAVLKASPVWKSGVANKTGRDEVDVLFGGLTSIDIPEELVPPGRDVPDEGPWGIDPRVVKVSPGTEVTWTWWEGGIPHGLVSFFDPPDHGQEFHEHGKPTDSFSHTFDEAGTYLYFCHPHGTPYSIDFGPLEDVENLFGQRGAVKVVDD